MAFRGVWEKHSNIAQEAFANQATETDSSKNWKRESKRKWSERKIQLHLGWKEWGPIIGIQLCFCGRCSEIHVGGADRKVMEVRIIIWERKWETMGLEKSWQLKDWWSSAQKNGWPLLMGSFYGDELLCAISVQTRSTLVTDLLSYLLWINYLRILSWFWFWTSLITAVTCITNLSPTKHIHMVLNYSHMRRLSSLSGTIDTLRLSRRLCFTNNRVPTTKHPSKEDKWKTCRGSIFTSNPECLLSVLL